MVFCFMLRFSHTVVKVAHLENRKKNVCAPDEAEYYTNQESIDLKSLEDQRKAYGSSYPTFSAGIF